MSTLIVVVVLEALISLIALAYLPDILLEKYEALKPKERLDSTIEIRKLIVTASGAVLVASTALLSWYEYRLEEYKDFGKQVGAAISLISSDNQVSRVGGVYGLARVIDDSPNDADQLLETLVFLVNSWASQDKNAIDSRSPFESSVALNTFGRLQEKNIDKCGGLRFAHANFRYLRVNNSSFKYCDMLSIDFTESSLKRTSFRHSTLTNVIFDESDLSFVDFRDADMQLATFHGADLRGAKFVGATGLKADYFKGAIVDRSTIFPQDLVSELKSLVVGVLR